jgi:hypothetical protein
MTKLRRLLALLSINLCAVAACSDSETVVAVTISSDSEIGAVSKLQVTVTPVSGMVATAELVPPANPDGGAILSSFFVRVILPDDPEGSASVLARALDPAGNVIAIGATMTSLRSKGAVAASIMMMPGSTLPPPDGGTQADGGASDATEADASEAGADND